LPFKKDADLQLNIKVDAQKQSLKGILLLFMEPYAAGTRDSEKYIFPNITKVSVTINSSPNMLYNKGIKSKDMWKEATRFFVREKSKTKHMQKFYTKNWFGLLIDLPSMANQTMHSSGTRIVNSTNGVHLEIEQKTASSGTVNCHVFLISDAQFNIMGRQLESVQNLLDKNLKYKMDPGNIPFNALIVGLTNSGETKFLLNQLCGPFAANSITSRSSARSSPITRCFFASLKEICDFSWSSASSTKWNFA